jgi:hypothetical protein
VGKPAWSKELISLGFKWRARAGMRQRRNEGKERKVKERKGEEESWE